MSLSVCLSVFLSVTYMYVCSVIAARMNGSVEFLELLTPASYRGLFRTFFVYYCILLCKFLYIYFKHCKHSMISDECFLLKLANIKHLYVSFHARKQISFRFYI